jgi:hypothetical protein
MYSNTLPISLRHQEAKITPGRDSFQPVTIDVTLFQRTSTSQMRRRQVYCTIFVGITGVLQYPDGMGSSSPIRRSPSTFI